MQAVAKGKVGYDLSRFDDRISVRSQVNKEREATRAKNKTERAAVEKAKPAVSGFAVFSFIACIGLVVLTLFSYVQLTELSDATISLQNELETLREENQLLEIENSRKFSAEKIKEEAELKDHTVAVKILLDKLIELKIISS